MYIIHKILILFSHFLLIISNGAIPYIYMMLSVLTEPPFHFCLRFAEKSITI